MEALAQVRAALYAEGRWLGLAHDMRKNFGLRAKESLLSTEVTDNRLVVRGAKGGRPRVVYIVTEHQWKTIYSVQSYLAEKNQRSLCPIGLSLKQAYSKQARILHKVGATKKNSAHAHVLRHSYAQKQIAQGFSRKHVAEELGHGREEVVGHYVEK